MCCLLTATLGSAGAPAQANFATDAASSAKAKLTAGEKAFVDSELLKGLREKTDLNKAKNKREIVDKYCYRQAELGVGDCAGLRVSSPLLHAGPAGHRS